MPEPVVGVVLSDPVVDITLLAPELSVSIPFLHAGVSLYVPTISALNGEKP